MSNRVIGFLILLGVIISGIVYVVFFGFPLLKDSVNNSEDLVGSGEVYLKEVEPLNFEPITLENNVDVIGTGVLSSKDKINDLKENIGTYKTILIGDKKFIFSKQDNYLVLMLNGNLVGNFDLVSEDKIHIINIYGSDKEFLLLIGDTKYIYNSLTGNIYLLDFNISIDYIKKSGQSFLIKTEKGIFLFDYMKDLVEYNDMFDDFIYYNDGYLGIVKFTDLRRLNNLGLGEQNKNIIMYYNPETKEKEIIYQTDLNLTKIYSDNTGVFFEVGGKNVYRLENY